MTATIETWLRPVGSKPMSPSEREAVTAALARGYLRADGCRVLVLTWYRVRCREAGRPAIWTLGARVALEGIDAAEAERLAAAMGAKLKRKGPRLELTGADAGELARWLAELLRTDAGGACCR